MIAEQWFLPTNTHNLSMMISQGLIAEPDGCNKYYSDILKDYPGYIPVIKNSDVNRISNALESALSEGEHLTACIIVMDLKVIISGKAFCEKGDIYSFSNKNSVNKEFTILYIPSPLPIQCISGVIFKDVNDKEKSKRNITTWYRNVSLTFLKNNQYKIAHKYFVYNENKKYEHDFIEENSVDTENLYLILPQRKKINYDKVYAKGGVVGSLFYLTKNGSNSEGYFNKFVNSNIFEDETELDYDFRLISNFFKVEQNSTEEISSSVQMISTILDVIVNCKDFKNSIIQILKTIELNDKVKKRANEISELLQDYSRNKIVKPASVIFQESLSKSKKSKIETLLLMMFHRDSTESLFECDFDIFNEIDYVLFAMLFGMRDKYKGLPSFLIEYDGLQFYVSNIMATYAHELSGSDISFKDVNPPLSLNSMLNHNKLDFILWINKILELDDCFESVMPNKDFTNTKGKSVYQGIVLPKLEKIDDKYFNTVSKKIVDDKLYNKILNKYKKCR